VVADHFAFGLVKTNIRSELPHLVEARTKAGQEVIDIPFGSLI